jgi:hypothetical protein
MNDANPCRGEHVRTKSDAAARAREAGDGTRSNDRISSLLCRPANSRLPEPTLKITHFLRQGQMIRTMRIRATLLHVGRAKKTAAKMTAPTASAGTANPIRQAAPANGPTSRKRTRTPDQAIMPVPIRSAIQPILSTEGDSTAAESVTQAFDALCMDRGRFFVR